MWESCGHMSEGWAADSSARRGKEPASVLSAAFPGVLSTCNTIYSLEGHHDAEAEAPVLWPPVAKSRLIGKDFDAGKN